MRFPIPSLRAYAEFVAVVLLTLAVLQYTGIFSSNAGEIDWVYLVGSGIVLPITTYLWSVLVTNVRWLPDWERMSRSGKTELKK